VSIADIEFALDYIVGQAPNAPPRPLDLNKKTKVTMKKIGCWLAAGLLLSDDWNLRAWQLAFFAGQDKDAIAHMCLGAAEATNDD